MLPADAGLADRLFLARETAEAARTADARSRSSLYRALGQAYDFALAAENAPEDYAELLADSGLTAQLRAPMTPVVKLVFGVHYDKARVTEFAAALAPWPPRGIAEGGFTAFLESFGGGLKAMVAAERKLRKPAAAPAEDSGETARATLRAAPARAYVDIDTNGEEFVLLVGPPRGGRPRRRPGPGRRSGADRTRAAHRRSLNRYSRHFASAKRLRCGNGWNRKYLSLPTLSTPIASDQCALARIDALRSTTKYFSNP